MSLEFTPFKWEAGSYMVYCGAGRYYAEMWEIRAIEGWVQIGHYETLEQAIAACQLVEDSRKD